MVCEIQLLPQEEAVMGKGEDKTHNKREEGARGGKRSLLKIRVDQRRRSNITILFLQYLVIAVFFQYLNLVTP